MSTKSTSAPQYKAQLAEATKVMGLVHKRSPGPKPKAKQAKCSAEVALVVATACCAWQYFATAASKLGTTGPCVKKSERSTLTVERAPW